LRSHASAYLPNKSQLALLLALLGAASAWCYADFILIPHEKNQAARDDLPRGNLSDLYPRWLGTRELLLHGRDPYTPQITREIQTGYYGRPLDPTRPNDPKDQQAFAYPLYVAFLLAPTVRLPFSQVQAGFRWLLVFLTLFSVPLWLRALRWRVSTIAVATWVVITLGSLPVIQGLKLQQLSLLVCALLAACTAAATNGALILAGILLAVATIKPQLTAIVAAWLLLWAFADWRSRKRLALSFALTMVALLIGSEVLLPGWVGRFRAAAAEYWQYTGGGKSILDVGLGTALGKPLAVLVLCALAILCWRMRREPADSPGFAWALSLVLAVTIIVIPTFALYNQLLLLPAFMLVVRSLPAVWEKGRMARWLVVITAVAVFWSWVTAALADLALLFFPRELVQKTWAVPLYPSFTIPVAVLGLLAISAVAAFAKRPQATSAST
jgi:hypothetical protein